MLKVAILGNMNNNGFALMRYLRDLGIDANLLLYKGDGENTLSHFRPENDTWVFEKWCPYIRRTNIDNGPFSVVGNPERIVFPYQIICYLRYLVKKFIGRSNYRIMPPTRRDLSNELSGFDKYIGSGLSPAIFNRAEMVIDIFFPYGTGVEFLGSHEFLNQLNNDRYLVKKTMRLVQKAQLSGLKRTKYIINGEMSLTREVLVSNNIAFTPMAVPMIYNREVMPDDQLIPVCLSEAIDKLNLADFSIFSHTRHMWVKPSTYSEMQWKSLSKNNDWLFRAFAMLLTVRPHLKSKMVIMEYGLDLDASHRLCAELGIQEHIIWLPSSPRRELLHLLSFCDIGVGEFKTEHGFLWGGTGWEILSQGKPLLQSLNFDNGEFESIFGYPPPPMLPVKSPDCILRHLIDMADHPEKREAIARGAADWFNRYNGIGLAQQWLDILSGTD